MFKIMIDSGHYGLKYNQSTVIKTYYESDRMWKLHKLLVAELKKYECKVSVTRSNTEDLSLYKRGLKAKGYNLFLSLHSNASSSEKTDYVVVFRGLNKQADEFGLKLAKSISNLMECKQTPRTAYRYNSTKTDEYYGVLRGANAAGVTHRYIVEHGFHTNQNNTEWLLSDDNLELMAQSEAKCIAEYFGLNMKYQVKIVRSKGVPIRSKPTSKSDSLGRISVGKKQWIIMEQDGFGLLKDKSGWINLKYTESLIK